MMVQDQIKEVVELQHWLAQSEHLLDEARRVSTDLGVLSDKIEMVILHTHGTSLLEQVEDALTEQLLLEQLSVT